LFIIGGRGFTIIIKVAVHVPPALVALIVTNDVPRIVGVPNIEPVAEFNTRPTGNPVAP
jgi:hypothetical protein